MKQTPWTKTELKKVLQEEYRKFINEIRREVKSMSIQVGKKIGKMDDKVSVLFLDSIKIMMQRQKELEEKIERLERRFKQSLEN